MGRDEAAERSSSSSGRPAEPHPLVNRRAKRRLRLGAARRVQRARGSRQRGEGQKARGTKRRWRLAAAESAVTASGLRLCLGDSTRTFAVVAAPCWPLARSWTGSRSHLDWTPAMPGPRSYKEQEPYATDAEVPRRLCLFGGSGANGSSLPLRLAPARSACSGSTLRGAPRSSTSYCATPCRDMPCHAISSHCHQMPQNNDTFGDSRVVFKTSAVFPRNDSTSHGRLFRQFTVFNVHKRHICLNFMTFSFMNDKSRQRMTATTFIKNKTSKEFVVNSRTISDS